MADGVMKHLVVVGAILGLGVLAPVGCESTDDVAVETAESGNQIERVELGGVEFKLELAIDDATRTLGMGGREFIAPDAGMLFVFKDPRPQAFVMRDCPIPIDILYLSRSGRIVRQYTMQPEPPQGADESDMQYELRLKRYPSGTNSQFVIELAGGRAAELGLQVGQTIQLDVERLKSLAR